MGSTDAAERDVRERVILGLFAEGRLSAGKAAELLGVRVPDLLDLITRRNVPWPYGPEDLAADVEALKKQDER